ncbi:MAG: hypothetical protein WHT82_03490 [Limisphaera sp.]|jgi:hypothetical protein
MAMRLEWTKRPWVQRALRVMLLLMGIASMVAGIWGGLLRAMLPLPLPVNHANWLTFHGPLMVCGFLGTLIGLERAVGLRAGWAYLSPLLCGLGGVLVAAGMLGSGPRWTLTVGSLVFVAVTLRIYRIQPAWSNALQGLGALVWLWGNLQWARGREIPQVVLCWLLFLLWTITGERLELTRFQKPVRGARALLGFFVLVALAGLAMGSWDARGGGILLGAAVAATALWLTRFDLAWRTLRFPGLPRFMAVCLLTGYLWLFLAGVWIARVWPLSSGVAYDGALHAFFVGFVFSMIFGHAPVIFPSVLGLPVVFRAWSYAPLVVLHGSLGLRLMADAAGWASGRAWGAAGNAVAIGLFFLTMLGSHAVGATRPARSPQPRETVTS